MCRVTHSGSWNSPVTRVRRLLGAIGFSGGVGLAGSISAGSSECPENVLRCDSYFSSESLTSREPRAMLESCAAYDLPAGWLWARAQSASVEFPAFGLVQAVDAYEIGGVPAGGLIPFEVAISVHGEGGGAGYGDWRVRVMDLETQASTSLEFYSPEPQSWSADTVLTLGIVAESAAPFHLLFDVRALAGRGFALVRGDVSFRGLPAGASIASCQGYLKEQPVQTLPSSWGRVKAVYR